MLGKQSQYTVEFYCVHFSMWIEKFMMSLARLLSINLESCTFRLIELVFPT